VPQRLPRYLAFEMQQGEEAEKIARILLEVGEALPEELRGKPMRASADGHHDIRRRGTPIISKGISGAIPGTDPLRYVLSQENKRRRR
jgi:hypothetical protein